MKPHVNPEVPERIDLVRKRRSLLLSKMEEYQERIRRLSESLGPYKSPEDIRHLETLQDALCKEQIVQRLTSTGTASRTSIMGILRHAHGQWLNPQIFDSAWRVINDYNNGDFDKLVRVPG